MIKDRMNVMNTPAANRSAAKPAKNEAATASQNTKDSVEIGGFKGYIKNIGLSTLDGAFNGFSKVGDAVDNKMHDIFMPTGDGLDHPGAEIACGLTAAAAGAVIGAPVGATIGFVMGVIGRPVEMANT